MLIITSMNSPSDNCDRNSMVSFTYPYSPFFIDGPEGFIFQTLLEYKEKKNYSHANNVLPNLVPRCPLTPDVS